jgi:hypothetical protein
MSALVLGDIVGQSGCRALFIGLKPLVKRYNADLVVVNGENAADGLGITPQIVSQLLSDGVDVITTGNHIWQKREIYPVLDENPRILRPANYPHCKVGRGHTVIEVKGTKVAVVNLQGRVRMSDIDCPFTVGKELIRKLRDTNKIVIVDFHAEEPEEKEALAYWLNGMVTAVVGTHTHVQTADERILSGGTAFITDLGMIGPQMSVIGVDPEIAIRRSMTQMPLKMPISDTPASIHGVHLSIDISSGKALAIERIDEQSRY